MSGRRNWAKVRDQQRIARHGSEDWRTAPVSAMPLVKKLATPPIAAPKLKPKNKRKPRRAATAADFLAWRAAHAKADA